MRINKLADRIAFNTEFKTEVPERAKYVIECERSDDNVGVKIEVYEDDTYEYTGKGRAEHHRGYTKSEDELIEHIKQIDKSHN